MIKLFSSICIEASAETVWARLAKLEDIQLWSAAVLEAWCEGDVSQGVGAERVCELAGNQTIRERWVAWEEGRSFTYEGFGLPMVKRAVNRWTVVPSGEKCLLTSEAELELAGGLLNGVLEPVFGPLIRKMATNALAPFKYFVEHGRPFKGRASELRLAPAAC